MKKALSIAGFDPTGWAGVIADVKAFWAMGVEGLSAITALTVQDLASVGAVSPVSPVFLSEEITTLLDGFGVDAVKIGMLATAGNVRAVSRVIKEKGLKNIVLDTVFSSTGGHPLLDKDGVEVLKRRLLPLCTVVTPNLDEASVLAEIRINGPEEMEYAAVRISGLGAANVLVKGGHLEGPPVDILFDGKGFHYFEARRIKAPREAFHGTGCMLSSALTAGLARGKTVRKAAEEAKRYTEKVIRERIKLMSGKTFFLRGAF